jgi:elongation factor G
MNIKNLRNIGISAHIDSGKTTLSERILFYAGRIHKMHEVHGNGSGATMDHMELEKERGITITSAATSVQWNDHAINLIDTPGHVDFTVEVERSLRVLDSAVLVLCSVGGVQSQSLTVDRQIKRYRVPRLIFINKLDRTGADPLRVCQEVQDKLACDTILMQLPIGLGEEFRGLIDLVTMQAVYFEGHDGEILRHDEIPEELATEAASARSQMLEKLAMYSDLLMEKLLSEQEVEIDLIRQVTREAVQHQDTAAVFMGSAYRNKGVQLLLDAIVDYLPSPLVRKMTAMSFDENESEITLKTDPDEPFVGMAFKIVDEAFGQLTYLRLYQGTIERGGTYVNQRTGRRERFSRLFRMHADKREEIETAVAGDIVAVMGIDGGSGDTYAAEKEFCTLENMFVPEPVIEIAIRPTNRIDADRLGKALARFRKEDPTLRVTHDNETGEMLLAGMGELHLEVYLERIRREYKVTVESGAPKVSYREAPGKLVQFNYKHRKQTGGSGQYAHIVGQMEPIPFKMDEPYQFEESIVGGRIPKQYIPSIDKGFRRCLAKGPVAEFPVIGLKVVLEDGSYHEVDSSDKAFQNCAEGCFRETFPKTRPILLEPIMQLAIECPESFQGTIAGDINSRRGIMLSNELRDNVVVIDAQVPLAEMFGYATDLRSMTRGEGSFTMELHNHRRVPVQIQEELIAELKKQKEGLATST